ncbi:MAG: dihydrolipoyl dehydrogenase [Gemmatimonadota bacterium]|nr:dihydrolipoyl dehydrogenase [Gemmatimonadota bacterium]
MTYDVVVIGGGSAGYAAARVAADNGAQVAIVDKGPLGGLCILRGCMPSKTLLRSSDVFSLMKRAREFGLNAGDISPDLAAVNDRKRALVDEFADYRVRQLCGPRFTLIRGRARFESPNSVCVGTEKVSGRRFVIAVGSAVSRIPVPGLEETGYLTSDDVLELRELPGSVIVLGGGAVAAELGQFLCRMGSRTTLIQRSGQLLSGFDADMVLPVETRLKEEGMQVYSDTRLQQVSGTGGRATVRFLHGNESRTATADVVFNALGRTPDLAGLALERAGVEVRDGSIAANDRMQTSAEHIFAAGDCVGPYEIVHIAVQQGEVAGHNAGGGTPVRTIDYRLRTSVVFTDPQVASVGPTERECREQGIAYLSAEYPFSDHGKSMVMGEIHGTVKILCHPASGELIAGHITGPEASELIHELAAVIYYRGTVFDLLRIPHYHPTLAEIITYPAEELADTLDR